MFDNVVCFVVWGGVVSFGVGGWGGSGSGVGSGGFDGFDDSLGSDVDGEKSESEEFYGDGLW